MTAFPVRSMSAMGRKRLANLGRFNVNGPEVWRFGQISAPMVVKHNA